MHPPIAETKLLSNRQAAHHPAARGEPSLASPGRGVLPFASMPAPRSPQIEQVARRADQHSRRGFELAGRKAYYSARSEFVQALRAIAQALDAQSGTVAHAAALMHGLEALEESDDFVATGSILETHIDVAADIDAHRTPILRGAELRGVSPLVALQQYYTYAQEQLGVSVGHELAGSMALHGLGKVHAALATQDSPGTSGEAKAIVLERAALLAYPGNFMAANDLGVLLARVGRYAEAREALMQSLSVAEHPETWKNLAVVHQALGENQLAQLARHEAGLAATARGAQAKAESPAAGMVNWLPPSQFAGTTTLQNATAEPAGRTAQIPPFEPPRSADDQPRGQGIMSWLPWKFDRE